MPEALTWEQAGGFAETFTTAHDALFTQVGLSMGERVCIHGAAGGVGTACIQLAVAMGAEVIGVVSTEAKAEVARAAGAQHTVLVEGFKDAAREITGGTGVDLVVDPVGGDRFTDSLRSLATLGKVLVVGFTAGDIPTVKVNRVLLTNTDVVGVGWGAFAMARPGYLADQWEQLLPHILRATHAPRLDEVLITPRIREIRRFPTIVYR